MTSGVKKYHYFAKEKINMKATNWSTLSPEEKKIQLFLQQKETLDLFLARNAISQAQYDKSYGDLVIKMGMEELVIQQEADT